MPCLVKTSLLKVICRGIWLCKLTYPVSQRLTSNNSDLRISAIRATIYEMTISLSSILTLHRSVQLSLNAHVNWTMKRSRKQIKTHTKQSGIMWCQQCNKPDAIGRNRALLAQRLWTATNYVKNATRVSSCNLEQVTLFKYPNKNTYKINNANIGYQLLHQSR